MLLRKAKSSLILTCISVGCLYGISACSQETSTPAAVEEVQVPTPTFVELQQSVLSAMGIVGVQRIEYTANGWEACLGQPWNIENGWARWEITDYKRVIDYSTTASYQTAQRRAGLDPDRLGGCGAQPNASASGQTSSVSESSSWEQQLQLWLTPQGFLALAASANAAVSYIENGYQVSFSMTSDDIEYSLSGDYSEDFFLQSIETKIDNTVFGDMLVEAEFANYTDYAGVKFPASIVQKQGGFSILELEISGFIANTTASTEAPPGSGGGFRGGPPQGQDVEPITSLAEGIYVVNGGYQSVIVEFDDYLVVIDGLQSDSQARQIIRLAKEAVPNKPISYVINTHLHFDHAGGLRDFIAEGATIVTHQMNKAFYETALLTPRTLNTDGPSIAGLPINIIGVGDEYVIEDGNQSIEIYKINGNPHADDMLIAYIPSIKTIVEADILQPWINPVFAGSGSGPHPSLVLLASELERLGLDYDQFVPIHRPTPAPTMTKADLIEAIQ